MSQPRHGTVHHNRPLYTTPNTTPNLHKTAIHTNLRRPRIMRNNLNLNPHIILPQPRNPHTSPQRLMPRHPLSEPAYHSIQRLIVDRHMVRVHPEHLGPAFSAGGAQGQVDVCEGLGDLRVDFAVEFSCLGVPTA